MSFRQTFEGFLRVQFKGKYGEDKVRDNQFHILDLDNHGAIIEKHSWTPSVRRGMTLSMSMIMSSIQRKAGFCARMGCNGLASSVDEYPDAWIW